MCASDRLPQDQCSLAASEYASESTRKSSETHIPLLRVKLVHESTELVASRSSLNCPNEAFEILRRYLEFEDREHLAALMLDAKSVVLGIHTISVGSLTSALVSPREVFKAAILANAASIVLAHNHPSGDPTPSMEDYRITEVLASVGAILDIPVLDHVIIGHGGRCFSIKQDGRLQLGMKSSPHD